ncbi:MAG: AraC family transcriptional regulator [Clostridiaceae bacterium]|nr:AraC family transcriptional regulator [Clostridiaceae bacterium]
MHSDRELYYKEYLRRETGAFRAPYTPELAFYTAIKTGDINRTKELLTPSIVDKQGLGTLSAYPLQSLKYHLVITIAMIARYCIEGGMDLSEAYGLSDLYIQKTDISTETSDIVTIHRDACLDYANRMRLLRKRRIQNMNIVRSIEYIYDNLHTRITVSQLSRHIGLDPAYMSRLFKKEVGVTISEYVRSQKIETAKNMLVYSGYSAAQIASILAFPSQSYFSEIFKKHTGMTPSQYRKAHAWDIGLGQHSSSADNFIDE